MNSFFASSFGFCSPTLVWELLFSEGRFRLKQESSSQIAELSEIQIGPPEERTAWRVTKARGQRRKANRVHRFKLTPSERAALETGAAESGASLSQHARELCLRRSGAAQIVAGTRRNPAARQSC